jgi:hypothetical protein
MNDPLSVEIPSVSSSFEYMGRKEVERWINGARSALLIPSRMATLWASVGGLKCEHTLVLRGECTWLERAKGVKMLAAGFGSGDDKCGRAQERPRS